MPVTPSAPPMDSPVLPPTNAPGPSVAPPAPQGDGTQMTLVSPSGGQEGEGADWAIVLGIALAAEIALLWLAACLGLVRKGLATRRESTD
ncbi:hypothetical protein [Spirillospora sp. CA-294931]|uniref:hypothetical protein n=1 Tax=Spirillospora sp. CA-294931 TaxID=3240042 RepID=UPI003D920F84